MDTIKRAMVEALEKSLGVVTTACKISGVGRSTHYVWFNDDEEYKAAVIAVEDIAIDFAESNNGKHYERSKNPEEKTLGQRLSAIRQAKKGKGSNTFYPEYSEMIKDHDNEIVKGLLDI